MNKKFKLQITMLSDWHIGTGAGIPGSVDKKIIRDRDGFPFMPAKTINGIWRDALETLAYGLDNCSICCSKCFDGRENFFWVMIF